MKSLSYSLEQVQEIAEEYGLDVFPVDSDRSLFLIVGDKTTIKLKVGKKLPLGHHLHNHIAYLHAYGVYLGKEFRHPTYGVIVKEIASRIVHWTQTENIREAISAATYIPESEEVLIPSEVRLELAKIYSMQDGRCAYCRQSFPFRKLTCDHIIPRSRGGNDSPTNWCLACEPCNSEKADKKLEEFTASGQKVVV